MTTHSKSKVRAAPGISSVVFILFLSFNVAAQSNFSSPDKKKITLICESMHFDKVLEQLTRQTGVQFIYSSSIVPSDRPVTMTVEKLPLTNVLVLIGNQMEVSFKKQGDYYIVKRISPAGQTAGTAGGVSQHPDHRQNVEEEKETEASPPEDEVGEPETNQRFRVSAIDTNLRISDNTLAKDFFYFGPGLAGWDTAMILKRLPLFLDKQSLSRYKKNLFGSFGLTVNDYSVGLEAQAGLPAFYTIINVSFLNTGVLRFGYGLGTSVEMKPGLAANLTYTFATIRTGENDAFQNFYRSTGQHHQVRLMANITLSKHFSLRIGPSFNILNTNHYLRESPPTIIIRSRSLTPNTTMPARGNSQASTYPVPKNTLEYRTSKTWAGFEAAFSYRINFSLRK